MSGTITPHDELTDHVARAIWERFRHNQQDIISLPVWENAAPFSIGVTRRYAEAAIDAMTGYYIEGPKPKKHRRAAQRAPGAKEGE